MNNLEQDVCFGLHIVQEALADLWDAQRVFTVSWMYYTVLMLNQNTKHS